MSTYSKPKLGRPKKIRYKTLPNGQQIKIVPKRRKSLVNGPSPSTSRLPRRGASSRSSFGVTLNNRTTSRPPPNRVSFGGALPNRNIPSRALSSSTTTNRSLSNRSSLSGPLATRIFPNRGLPQRDNLARALPNRDLPNRSSLIGTLSNPLNKITPKQELPQDVLESPDTTSTITKITTKEKLMSSPASPSPSTEPTSSSSGTNFNVSNKRKSHHVTKPISEITFEESVEVVRNENTELMEYVACLRVALNNLLSEVDVGNLELPGAVGKVKIFEKVKQMIKERNQTTDDEEEKEDNLSISSEQQELVPEIEEK